MRKVNGRIWKVVVVLLLAAVGVIYGYGRLNNRVEAVEKEAEIAKDTRERVIRIETGMEYLKQAVDRIEKKVE